MESGTLTLPESFWAEAKRRAAAVAAIESGEEAITGRALSQAAYRGPDERRAQLDRAVPRSAA